MVASPTQPKPILAIVIPNCVAAIYLSKSLRASQAMEASLLPSSLSCNIFVLRELTNANSDATKKPFARSKQTITKLLNIILVSDSICSPTNFIF